MNNFIKLPEPIMYQVDSSFEFVICTELDTTTIQHQVIMRGKRYRYDDGEVVYKGLSEVCLDVQENHIAEIDENGKYVD